MFQTILAINTRSRPGSAGDDNVLIPIMIGVFALFVAFGLYSYWQWRKDEAKKGNK